MSDNQQANLRKYSVGTVKHPYPMMYRHQNVQGKFEADLGVLQSDENPLQIYSEKEYGQVVGMMYRDMPTPGMLEVFKQGQLQRTPQHQRKVEFFMGDAGAGKSFLANLNAKMRTQKGALLVDCGGRDLNELLYETVLDYEAGKGIYDAIDAKLADGTMNPASVGKLRAALGSAFKEQDGKFSVDWQEMGISRSNTAAVDAFAATQREKQNLSEEDIAKVEAWKNDTENNKAPSLEKQQKYDAYHQAVEAEATKLNKAADQQRDAALAAVREVASLEGLDKGEDVSIGLKTREGAIIRAWKENRPIILDEYNKAKPGTDDALQILWQVFIGEMDKHTVEKGGESFTFDRTNMPEQFFVTLTGNKTRDGYSTRSLSASAYQRLKPHYIEPPTVEDLQHRICQQLTGMPVSTIYAAQEEYWSEHKDQFTDFLIEMRKLGLSEEQQANIPSWQFEMLKNWPQVVKASGQLAELYDHWAQVVDPDSALHATPTGEVAEVTQEIDKAFATEIGVGLRRMMAHMSDAIMVTPEAISSKASTGVDPNTDWSQPEELDETRYEAIEKRYGTRLSKVILKDINDTSVGKDKLLSYMLRKAAEAGLFEMMLEEGKSTGDRLISDLLDIDPEKQKQLPENIEEIHNVLCDYLRSKFPEIPADAENTDIVSPSALDHALTQLNGMDEVERFTSRTGKLHLPSIDLDSDDPLTTAVSLEARQFGEPTNAQPPEQKEAYEKISEEEKDIKNAVKLPSENLVDAERYLISLAIPNIRKNNIDALFSENGWDLDHDPQTRGPFSDTLSGSSPNGLSATMLAVKTKDENGNDRDEFLHVVHDSFANRNEGRTLITGSIEISPRLAKALEATGVTYVNRNDADALDKINGALDDILQDKEVIQDQNQAAFCPEQLLSVAISRRLGMKHTGHIQKGGQEVSVYDLPHGDIHFDNLHSFVSDEVRGQHRENLACLLSDKDGHLDKSKGQRIPNVLLDSPDLDHLKNTVRSLSNDGQKKAAGMGK